VFEPQVALDQFSPMTQPLLEIAGRFDDIHSPDDSGEN
jgi:hypothetical protein